MSLARIYRPAIALTLALGIALSGCGGEAAERDVEQDVEQAVKQAVEPQAEQSAKQAAEAEQAAKEPVKSAEAGQGTDSAGLAFKPGFNSGKPYEPLSVTPSVRDYTIAPGLANVENKLTLSQAQIDKIVANGFVVTPTEQEQLFYIYEDNDYKNIPNFITTDSVLQAYHVFYNYAVRTAEAEAFYPQLLRLNANMLNRLIELYEQAKEPLAREQALRSAAYFAVAQLALGESVPDDFPLIEEVRAEAALVAAAEAHAVSPLFGCGIDYSLLRVRGHYTRSELLGRYFTAMAWYGVVPFRLYDEFGEKDTESALRAAITAIALCGLEPEEGGGLWESIYSATGFFVGAADDVTPYQMAEIIVKVYGDEPSVDSLADGLDELYKAADALPKPRIVSKNRLDVTGPQMRFMGQRYIPDSEILQELSESILRPFPSGLDVLAVLGWERAAEHIKNYENPAALWPDYDKEFERMHEQFQKLPDSEWQSNLYYAWLYTLRGLKDGYGAGYPKFMQSPAWMDKTIATALASWAELRHDTILYGKSSGAEKGGGADMVIPAYVEPNPEVYNRLLWMTVFARENLSARGLLTDNLQDKMSRFEELLTYLTDCAVKELRGEDLAESDYNRLRSYGGWLESLTSSLATSEDGSGIVYWYEIESDADRNMAVIADVHTASLIGTTTGYYLEEGVGHAAEIYAVFPADGKLYLGRGAVFDYFEFESDKRLTDEEWQAMLKQNPPPRPKWTRGYMAH